MKEAATESHTQAAAWPADRFYWSLLDAPMGRSLSSQRAVPLPPGLCAAMQDDVPVPMETLHAIGLGLVAYEGALPKVLAVAAQRDDLAALSPMASSLTPASIPPLDDRLERIDPARLNMLVGDFEPRTIRRARTLRHMLGMAAVLAAAGLTSVGLHRRADHAASLTHAAEERAASLLNEAAAETGGVGRQALQRELARIRAIRSAMNDPQATADAMPALLSVLKAWPASTSATPQTLGVSGADGGLATLSVAVEGDPAEFLRRFTPPAGWTLDEPRLNAAGSVTRVVLTLRPTKATHAASTSPQEAAR